MGSVAIRNVYVDYLLSTNGHISAIDLSEALDSRYSLDQISHMLYKGEIDDKAHGAQGKKVLILDDSLQHKPYSEVNGLVTYRYDHSQQRSLKGINFISALWADEQGRIPLSMQMVKKELLRDEKNGKLE